MTVMMRLAWLLLVLIVSRPRIAEEAPKPKFGPEADPIFQETAYLRTSRRRPDYWTLSSFYIPQRDVERLLARRDRDGRQRAARASQMRIRRSSPRTR